MLAACGDGRSADVAPIAAPTRTAAQDRAIRALAADLARHQACAVLRERFVPLPEDRPEAARRVVEGRLWVDRCEARREGDGLALSLGGRGWQWVERTAAGPLGTRFTVRGTVRLEARVELTSALDVRYDEDARRVLVALTPVTPPSATVRPIGTIPVEPEGGWSSLVGGLGSLVGFSPEAQARPLLEEEAALIVRRQLARGMTLAIDLCTGQPDVAFGPLGDGAALPPPPFPAAEGALFLDNQRVRLHAGGLDLSGPFSTGEGDGRFELEVESGGPVEAVVLCAAEAAALASRYLAGGVASPEGVLARQTVRAQTSLELRASDCAAPHVALTSPGDATVRYRVTRSGLAPFSLVDCAP